MGRNTLFKLIGAAIGAGVALGWPMLKSWRTESTSACSQVIGRAEIERMTGKKIDQFAGNERDYGCTAAWFPIRGPLEETTELFRVEMNRIQGYYDHVSKHPLWHRDERSSAPLEGVGERAILIERADGSHAVFAEVAGVTVQMYFRREFPRDKAVEVARGARLSELAGKVGGARQPGPR